MIPSYCWNMNERRKANLRFKKRKPVRKFKPKKK